MTVEAVTIQDIQHPDQPAVVRALTAAASAGLSPPFTYVEINGLRVPEPAAAYGLLWEALSGHDARRGLVRYAELDAARLVLSLESGHRRAQVVEVAVHGG